MINFFYDMRNTSIRAAYLGAFIIMKCFLFILIVLKNLIVRYLIVIFVTRATRAFLVETAQVLEAEPLGEARDARRDKKPFARVPKVILCVSMLKS